MHLPVQLFQRAVLLLLMTAGISLVGYAGNPDNPLSFGRANAWETFHSSIVDGGRNGGHCLQIKMTITREDVENWSGDKGAATRAFLPVDPKKKYYLSAWEKRAEGTGGLWIHVWAYDQNNHAIGDIVHSLDRHYVDPENEWNKIERAYIEFPPETASIRVCLETGTPADKKIDLKIDDVVFREMPVPNPRAKPGLRVVPAITSQVILPDTPLPENAMPKEIRLTGARGEYEPASFVVTAPDNSALDAVSAIAGELTSADGKSHIPANQIDLRIVKCWMIGGRNWTGVLQGVKILRPELLLKDAGMLKVNPTEKANYIRLNFPDGPRYSCVSNAEDEVFVRPNNEGLPLLNSKFPVQDASELQPVTIPRGTNQQFWVTFHVPKNAVPGQYTGEITVKAGEKILDKLPVRLTVLPFELLKPYYISSIYYKGELGGAGSIGAGNYSNSKNEKQYLAEMINLREHGVDNPSIHLWWNNPAETERSLAKILAIRRDAGLDNRELFIWGGNTGASQTPEQLNALKAQVKKVLDIAHRFGAQKVYFYGIDEAAGEKLLAERKAWEIVHQSGGLVYVAATPGIFKTMGDLLDIIVLQGSPKKEPVSPWHKKGHKVLNYAFPQASVEDSELYRRNYGLLLWQNDYDGAMNHAYQAAYGNPYNDFDGYCRDEIMAYPTVNGVVDTIEWEGYREGVDDVRYVTTLQHAIKNVDGKPPYQKTVSMAKAFLADLKKADLYKIDLDKTRRQMVDYILQLTPKK